VDHPLLADAACRSTVFNGRPRSSDKYLRAMMRAGVRHFRVDLLRESPDETRELLDRYAGLL